VQRLASISDASYAPWLNLTECVADHQRHLEWGEYWSACPRPLSWAYLNSGQVMGPISELLKVYRGMLYMHKMQPVPNTLHADITAGHVGDQLLAHGYAASHTDRVTLDYTGSLFGNMVHMQAPSNSFPIYSVEEQSGQLKLRNLVTNTTQCFVHGNGNVRIKSAWAQLIADLGGTCQSRYVGDARCKHT